VTRIKGDAFGKNKLTSVVISEGVVNIEGGAFFDEHLGSASIIIPQSVESIAKDAFWEDVELIFSKKD